MSRKNRIRVEGAVQVGKTIARRIPVVNDLDTAKDLAEGTHKILKGERITLPKPLLSWGELMDKRIAREERARDRQMSR
jgi:hypothetical protein